MGKEGQENTIDVNDIVGVRWNDGEEGIYWIVTAEVYRTLADRGLIGLLDRRRGIFVTPLDGPRTKEMLGRREGDVIEWDAEKVSIVNIIKPEDEEYQELVTVREGNGK